MRREDGLKGPEWIKAGRGVLAALGIAGMAACTEGGSPSGFTVSDAFQLCERAIRAAAPHGERAEIPSKDVRETVKVFSFLWRLGDGLTLPGPAAAQAAAAVTCRVNKETREVVFLEINGERTQAQ